MDMQIGYKIYVQFADQNGEWTNLIDLGYYFSTKLNLAEFIFPMIGSSSLEDTVTSGFVADIIGNPLGDMDLGGISGFEENSYAYTPSGINKKDAQNYTWQKTDYSFGWSNTFYQRRTTTSAERDDAKLKDYMKKIYDGKSKGAAPPKPSKYATKSRFKWSITPSVGFNLTLSTRRDGKTYFEDLVFYAKVDFEVSGSQQIQLPIGISILIKGGLSGDVAGIYHMYVDYQDSYETEDAVEYSSETFGIFKKFTNSVRREGYIFLNPKVSVALGVGYGVVFVTGNASFDFDMDFQFTEIGTNAYGDITIDLGWGIQLFNFEVYSKSLANETFKLFNTDGTDGHIDFDYGTNSLSMLSIEDFFSANEDDDLVMDQPTSREYLNQRGDWLGESGNEYALLALNASEGTKETTLLEGMNENPQIKLANLGNGKVLMVLIYDDGERSAVNKRTAYYSIYSSDRWSVPGILDDDGTLDDYPNLTDLGDGRILITWSSADVVLPDGATVEDAMKSMNIKARFLDKETLQMSDVMQVTKTTEGDYCADTMANAAYDADTGRLILYYTKTEYEDLEKVPDLSKAYSANAYLFYENGKWSDAADYTVEELKEIKQSAIDRYRAVDEDQDGKPDYTEEQIEELAEAYTEQYKKDWYGQRFLDVRTNKDGALPRVIDTTSIHYNGLGLFAWTVDWDKNLDTLNDRDVFMQIYNFAENRFTHIIRVTTESAAYTTPKFARSNNGTYLFFGETKAESGTEGETQLAEHGAIRYLDVSDLVKNGKYTKLTDGNSEYYIFQYKRDAYVYDADSNSETLETETVLAEPKFAAACDNPMDYDVKVSEDGQMYLFWTDAQDGARQIMTALYNGSDENDDDEALGENKQDADLSANMWSEPVMLTDVQKGFFYAAIGATAVNGDLIVADQKGEYANKGHEALVYQVHTPYAKVKATSVELLNELPQPSSTVTLRATVKNEGLLKQDASEEKPIPVTFTVNGENPVTVQITKPIPGGTAVNVECSVTLPEDLSNVEFAAFTSDADKVITKLEQKSDVKLADSKLERTLADGYHPETVVYSATLQNDGNADLSELSLKATVGKSEVGSISIGTLSANEMKKTKMELSIPDNAYELNQDGVGTAKVSVDLMANGEKITGYEGTVQKTFSMEAIEALSKVKDVKFENDGTYSMKVADKKDIQPTIQGVDENSLMVQWLESSDSEVAHINYDNMIVADGKGTATLTGILVPGEEKIDFTSGTAQKTDWQELIPSDKLITVTATVNVTGTNNGSHSTGGGSSSTTKYTLTFHADNGSEPGTMKVNKNDTVANLPVPTKEGYTFEGWYSDKAFTVPFTSETKVTSDLTLYAKWKENTKTPEENELPFRDVTKDDWFYSSVKYAYENKLFSGVTETAFAPYDSLTRAMLVTVLWRAEGMPETDTPVLFDDIDPEGYYAKALRWAVSEEIAAGMSDTEFAPNDPITREQIAAIMFRYAKLKGNAPQGAWAIALDYQDTGEIADWAMESVMFCKLKGIMLGDDTNAFRPKNNATRAETAAIVQRFLENLKNDVKEEK